MDIDRNITVESTEKVMQLRERSTERLIGNVPASHARTIDECIEYLGGEPYTDDLFQYDDGSIFRIRYELYAYDDLIITERKISNIQIDYLVDDTCLYDNAKRFAIDQAMNLGFIGPESTKLDEAGLMLIKQLRIFWHVMRDPFDRLVERMGRPAKWLSTRFCIPWEDFQEWLSGEKPAYVYIRLMMAEAIGLLTIRDLT